MLAGQMDTDVKTVSDNNLPKPLEERKTRRRSHKRSGRKK
jgi:hypothetical protein